MARLRARGAGRLIRSFGGLANDDGSLTSDGYFLLDVVAAWTRGPMELGLSVTNLTNATWDGAFAPVGGSEPAYNLSAYLGTEYKNDREVTFITGLAGPGVEDVWMSGFLDGTCDINEPIGLGGANHAGVPCTGKVSYLGGHSFATGTPLSGSANTQGARLFLNALYEADCVTAIGQPDFTLDLAPVVVPAQAFPVEADVSASYANSAPGSALDAVLHQEVADGAEIVAATGGTITGATVSWTVGSISGVPVHSGAPAAAGSRTSTLSFPAEGDYTVTLQLDYRVGLTTLSTPPQTVTIEVRLDGDGDGVPDEDDPFPDDPDRCGDADGDGCDDCDSSCNPGGDDAGNPDGGCCDTGAAGTGPLLLALLVIAGMARRSRRGRGH